MEISKELAIAMLAGVWAIDDQIHRKGASTYVFDPFNKQGLKAEMAYVDALTLLGETALDVLYEREE